MERNTVHTVFVYFPENEPILIGGYIGEPQIARGKTIIRNKFSAQKSALSSVSDSAACCQVRRRDWMGATVRLWKPHLGQAIRTKTITAGWRAVSQEIGPKKIGNLLRKMLPIMGWVENSRYAINCKKHGINLIVVNPEILLRCYIIERSPDGMGWDTLVCGVAAAAQEQSFLIFTRQLHFI